MLFLFFDKRPWFASKRFGYGAGLPIAWQGWVLLLSYLGLTIGAGLLAANGGAGPRGAMIAVVLVATATFVAIVHRRTAGGWRWRWGDRD
jgi:hypothetical protein